MFYFMLDIIFDICFELENICTSFDLKLHLHLYRFLATTRKNDMNRNFTLKEN